MRTAARALSLGLALVAAAPDHARTEPSDGDLVAGGLAMALPTYALGVVAHEGSHALAALALGGEVLEVRLYPGRNPVNGALQFGWVRTRGLVGRAERVTMLLAPRATDLLLLGGYGALWATESLPASPWGQLAVLVLATGFWVDFTKDVLVFHSQNDLVKVYDMLGLDDEWRRLPARLLHAAAAAGLGWMVLDGYRDLFGRGETSAAQLTLLPVVQGSF